MKRIRNFGPLHDDEIARCHDFLLKPREEAVAVNLRKHQFVFRADLGGRTCIAKLYLHRTLQHRVGAFLNRSNADRYAAIARILRAEGIPAPAPLLVLKSGRGPLPDRTLLVMERLPGEMLLSILPDVEGDRARSELLAKRVARLIRGLREAHVVHRDLNTKNFLVTEAGDVALIDFDAASRCRSAGRGFMRRHQRDLQYFLSTCHNAPRFAAAVADNLNRHEKLSV